MARQHASAKTLRDAVSASIGLVGHRTAAGMRRVLRTPDRAQTPKVAVFCAAFVRYASDQAIGLSQTGLNVTLYYVERRNEFALSDDDRILFFDRVEAAGVEIVRVPPRRLRSLIKDTIWLLRDVRRRQISVGVVQSHHDPRYAALGCLLPVAMMLHDPQTHTGDTLSIFPAPIRLIARVSECTSFCLIVHSPMLFDQIRPLLRRLPVGVVPHGAGMAHVPAPIPEQRQLLVFGRLFEYKGVDTALEAFRRLPDTLTDARLVVAGNGPLATRARGQQGVDVREGYVTEREVEVLLDGTRLVLLPYKDATQSGVGLQAVSRGIPCVVSRVGGLPELVDGAEDGLVVPPDDPDRLAQAIAEHIDHGEALRKSIYDHAAANFAWPVVALRLRCELQRLGLRDLAT